MNPGDVAVGVLVGAHETKVRPSVVIASATYLAERPNVLVGILTTKFPRALSTTDYILLDWQAAGFRAESCFRAYVLTAHRSELNVIGHLDPSLFTPALSGTRFADAVVTAAPRALAGAAACIATRALALGLATDPAAFDANYVRRPDAELWWKGR